MAINTDPVYGTLVDDNDLPINKSPHQQGVFGLHPLSTPKYAFNKGDRDAEFKDTLARMYVSLANEGDAVKQAYLASLDKSDQRVTALAQVLIGSNNTGGTGFVDFFLNQVNESFQEAVQIDKVLGDNYVAFFFGQQPPVFQYSGVLLNSMQDDFRSGFALAYQTMLRGTEMARRGALIRLRYDSVIVSGVMIAHSQVMNAENELAVPFSFSLLVKEYVVLQNPRFVKLQPSDYVTLVQQTELQNLSPVGRISDTRVRTVMLAPVQLADISTAGEEEDTNAVDLSLSAPQQIKQLWLTITKQEATPPPDILGTHPLSLGVPPPALAIPAGDNPIQGLVPISVAIGAL